MESQRFTDHEQAFLASHDIDSYDDPVARSIREWEICGNRWNDRLRFLQQVASHEQFEQGETDLAAAELSYAQHFVDAASTVAADSPIQEIAVTTLQQLIAQEDADRRQRISKWYQQVKLPDSHPNYTYDLAMTFGDPQGVTLPYDSTYTVFDQHLATEYFASRLAEQSHAILRFRRLTHRNYLNRPARRSLGSVTANIIRRVSGRREG